MSVDFSYRNNMGVSANMTGGNAAAILAGLGFDPRAEEFDAHDLMVAIESANIQAILTQGHGYCNVKPSSQEHMDIIADKLRQIYDVAERALIHNEKVYAF